MATIDTGMRPDTGPVLLAAPTAAAVRRPLLWLLAIVALALVVRLFSLTHPLQQAEFLALAAVAERSATAGTLPSAADPLQPVAGLDAVRDRSVLPFGIPNPHPLYNDVLYLVIRALPISEWSLRLPSLLAGLAC